MPTLLDSRKRSKSFRKRADVVLAVLALTDVIAETIDTVHANCGGLSEAELLTVTRALERCHDALGDCRPRLVG